MLAYLDVLIRRAHDAGCSRGKPWCVCVRADVGRSRTCACFVQGQHRLAPLKALVVCVLDLFLWDGYPMTLMKTHMGSFHFSPLVALAATHSSAPLYVVLR